MRRTTPIAILLFAITVTAQQGSPQTRPPSRDAPPATTKAPPPLGQLPQSQPGKYFGVVTCTNAACHGSIKPMSIPGVRVLQNEFYTWANNDRHGQAYSMLSNDRSSRIIASMHLKGKASEQKLCLACHTMNVPPSAIGLPDGEIDRGD